MRSILMGLGAGGMRAQPVKIKFLIVDFLTVSALNYAPNLILVTLILVNFFGFLVIAPYPTMRF